MNRLRIDFDRVHFPVGIREGAGVAGDVRFASMIRSQNFDSIPRSRVECIPIGLASQRTTRAGIYSARPMMLVSN